MTAYLSYNTINTAVFSDSYALARAAFLHSISTLGERGTEQKAYQAKGTSPTGEALFTDTIWLGNPDADKVVILCSGTHGVEGFVGSAVQIDHLEQFASRQLILRKDTAILMAHALTPWGFAWLRRCDDLGIDLNRNAVDFTLPLPINEGYEKLRHAFFELDFAQRSLAFVEFQQQFGKTAFEIAVSGGQYRDPYGPFFGGHQAAHGRLVTEDLIAHYALKERDLAVIDLHSGLGPYGYGEIICDHPVNSPNIATAHAWFGDAVTLPALGTSSSVPKLGLMDYIWHDIMNSESCHVTLEFGTYSTQALFEVLLNDHKIWSQQANATERLTSGCQMRAHFCPADKAWQALVLFRARQVISQVLDGLTGR